MDLFDSAILYSMLEQLEGGGGREKTLKEKVTKTKATKREMKNESKQNQYLSILTMANTVGY